MDWIIKYWVQAFFAIVLTLLTGLVKKLYSRWNTEKEEQKLMKEALKALLHDGLYRECMKHLQARYISVSALENLGKMYNSYHNLGGNSMGTDLYNRCLKLRVVDDIPNIEREV